MARSGTLSPALVDDILDLLHRVAGHPSASHDRGRVVVNACSALFICASLRGSDDDANLASRWKR